MPYHKLKIPLNVVIAEGAACKKSTTSRKETILNLNEKCSTYIKFKDTPVFLSISFPNYHPPQSNVGINQGLYTLSNLLYWQFDS